MGCHHSSRPVKLRRMGHRVVWGGGRQLALLDKLSDKLAQFGARGEELAHGPVLAPQITLQKLRREVRLGGQVQVEFVGLFRLSLPGTVLRCTRNEQSPSRLGVAAVAVARSGAEGVPFPLEVPMAAPSPWR